jgi:hypothetical protein
LHGRNEVPQLSRHSYICFISPFSFPESPPEDIRLQRDVIPPWSHPSLLVSRISSDKETSFPRRILASSLSNLLRKSRLCNGEWSKRENE